MYRDPLAGPIILIVSLLLPEYLIVVLFKEYIVPRLTVSKLSTFLAGQTHICTSFNRLTSHFLFNCSKQNIINIIEHERDAKPVTQNL